MTHLIRRFIYYTFFKSDNIHTCSAFGRCEDNVVLFGWGWVDLFYWEYTVSVLATKSYFKFPYQIVYEYHCQKGLAQETSRL